MLALSFLLGMGTAYVLGVFSAGVRIGFRLYEEMKEKK